MSHRIFLDASVLFSAAYSSSGFARDLLAAAFRPDVTLAVSADVAAEVTRNLTNKRPEALSTLRAFLSSGVLVRVTPDPLFIQRCEEVVEEKDAHVLAAALAAGAGMIATFDRRHLLDHARRIHDAIGVEVLTPDDVMRRIDPVDTTE